jgi:hypothetical protein
MKKALSALLILVAACGALTPAEQVQVAKNQVDLGVCAAEAHFCKRASAPDASLAPCWAEFDACMVAHGFQDGGPDATRDSASPPIELPLFDAGKDGSK